MTNEEILLRQRERQNQLYRIFASNTPAEEEPKSYVTLIVHKEYDSEPGSQAQIFVDEVEKEFDIPVVIEKGSTITLRAFPPEEYAVEHFVRWTDSSSSSTRTVVMDSDKELTAVFHANFS